MRLPIVTEISQRQRSPFEVLVATILSLRTKDEVTRSASKRLFEKVSTPAELIALSESQIAETIFPVGFYKTKAKTLIELCKKLLNDYEGNVPDDLDELLKLKGVGRKTANLVMTLGFGKLGVCVDTHVHRISNRVGYVKTRTPEQTEMALREKLPKKYWIEYNDLLVTWGQNVCRPISPLCSKCAILNYCCRIGVNRSR
ncbi:MAG: endonuclease III [Deltaproteobacteria bacterium]|nr:endonuclease III [Deltaproteobacteria bacterium]